MSDTTNITTAYTVRIPRYWGDGRGRKSYPAGSEVEILNRRAPGKHYARYGGPASISDESFLIKFSDGRSTWVRSLYILNREVG